MAGPAVVGHWADGSAIALACRRLFGRLHALRSCQVRQPDERDPQQGLPVPGETSLMEGVYPGGAQAG